MAAMENEALSQLLVRVALKDRKAFDRLYAGTSARLFAVTLRLMKDRAEAEDLLQDAYIRIWQRADRFRPGQAPAISWMIAVTRNLCIDRIRARQSSYAPIEMAEEIPDRGPTPEMATAEAEQRQQIDKCLEELEDRRAEALRAAYLEGYSYQDLAQRFETPLNTIRTWLRRGLMSLRNCLEQFHP
jgi:RNA polymerase sigma-70 factor (ECF subfamily)